MDVCIDSPPSLLIAYIPSLPLKNNNWMPPHKEPSKTEPSKISCCLVFLPTKNSHWLKQESFLMWKLESSKFVILYQITLSSLLSVAFNISWIPKEIIFDGAISLILNSITDIFLQTSRYFQNSWLQNLNKNIFLISF